MKRSTSTDTRTPDILDLVAADLGGSLSLGAVVANAEGIDDIAGGKQSAIEIEARLSNLLVTDPGSGRRRSAVPHAALADAPLVDAFQAVDDAPPAIEPFTVALTNAAAETAEGDPLPESTLTYTAGAVVPLPTIGHTIPVTRQALRHSAVLRSDINTFLTGGVLAKLEAAAAAALAGSGDTVAHPFDTDLATTVRTAVAVAQGAMPELGPGAITVAMSPADHAALDLAGLDLASWPARIVSSPALPDGTAYVARFKVAAQLFATRVAVGFGYVDDQLIRNSVTARATVEALAHLAAPAAIVKATLTA